MKRPQITIAELILVVLVAAIGLAAIRSGSPAWAGAMLSITFFAMIASLLGIALGRGTRRVYWLGFAVLGWSYLLLMCVPWLHGQVGRFLLAPNLFTYLDQFLHTDPQTGGRLQSVPLGVFGSAATSRGFGGNAGSGSMEDLSDFVRVGIAMEALLWAVFGGRAACYFASERDHGSTPTVAAPARASDVDHHRREDAPI